MKFKDRIKELKRVKGSQLRPNPRNWRTHPKEQADAAEIPEEVEAVDPSDEFKRLVDKTLGEAGAEAPAADEPATDVEEPAEEAGEPALN